MSSVAVRTAIKTFISAQAPTEKIVDITGGYLVLKDFLAAQSPPIAQNVPWLGVEFFADPEEPITIPATNTQGKYREIGGIYLHVVDIAKLTASTGILSRGEALRNAFRGQRIASDILIQSVTPVNFGQGATLSFDGGYTSGSVIIGYQYDFHL